MGSTACSDTKNESFDNSNASSTPGNNSNVCRINRSEEPENDHATMSDNMNGLTVNSYDLMDTDDNETSHDSSTAEQFDQCGCIGDDEPENDYPVMSEASDQVSPTSSSDGEEPEVCYSAMNDRKNENSNFSYLFDEDVDMTRLDTSVVSNSMSGTDQFDPSAAARFDDGEYASQLDRSGTSLFNQGEYTSRLGRYAMPDCMSATFDNTVGSGTASEMSANEVSFPLDDGQAVDDNYLELIDSMIVQYDSVDAAFPARGHQAEPVVMGEQYDQTDIMMSAEVKGQECICAELLLQMHQLQLVEADAMANSGDAPPHPTAKESPFNSYITFVLSTNLCPIRRKSPTEATLIGEAKHAIAQLPLGLSLDTALDVIRPRISSDAYQALFSNTDQLLSLISRTTDCQQLWPIPFVPGRPPSPSARSASPNGTTTPYEGLPANHRPLLPVHASGYPVGEYGENDPTALSKAGQNLETVMHELIAANAQFEHETHPDYDQSYAFAPDKAAEAARRESQILMWETMGLGTPPCGAFWKPCHGVDGVIGGAFGGGAARYLYTPEWLDALSFYDTDAADGLSSEVQFYRSIVGPSEVWGKATCWRCWVQSLFAGGEEGGTKFYGTWEAFATHCETVHPSDDRMGAGVVAALVRILGNKDSEEGFWEFDPDVASWIEGGTCFVGKNRWGLFGNL